MYALEMRKVAKSFGSVAALSDLSLQVKPRERVALLGPNGAGKTTAISLLLGLRAPTSGLVEVLGGDPRIAKTRTRVGTMLQETMLPPGIRVVELLEFTRSLYPRSMALVEAARRAGLEDILQRRVERLSGGQRRRVLFGMAIAGRPELLFLDEPTVGIDAETRKTFWEGLEATLEETGGTLLFTTHYLEEAERFATRVVVIRQGRLVADGTPRELRDQVTARTIRFSLAKELPIAQLREVAGATSVRFEDGTYTLLAPDPDDAVRRLMRAGIPAENLEIRSGSLEEALAKMSEEA